MTFGNVKEDFFTGEILVLFDCDKDEEVFEWIKVLVSLGEEFIALVSESLYWEAVIGSLLSADEMEILD